MPERAHPMLERAHSRPESCHPRSERALPRSQEAQVSFQSVICLSDTLAENPLQVRSELAGEEDSH